VDCPREAQEKSDPNGKLIEHGVPVDCPLEAQEKSDQNGKLFERSEFFPFRFFLSIAAKARAPDL
jgi:hypothetical protein